MATKTISITEEAYNLLKARKESGDSFSEVIKKEFGGESLWSIVGILSDEEADELEKNIKKFRKEAEEDFRRRVD